MNYNDILKLIELVQASYLSREDRDDLEKKLRYILQMATS